MLKVKKRGGTEEPFSPDKLRSSLALTSDGIRQPLNEADITSIINELKSILNEKTIVSTREIRVILTGILFTRGSRALAENYINHPSNGWK